MLADFYADEAGSTSIEYALVAILCSTAMIAALYDARTVLSAIIDSAAVALNAAT